jgi:hypothetical protein
MKEAADVAAAKEAVEEAAEKKKVDEEAVKKKAAEEATARKMATEEAAEKKKATKEAAMKKKATEEAVVKKAADEVAAKKKASEEAAMKTKSGASTAGSGPSPAPSVGVKRVAAPSGSTPPAKRRFHGPWKPWYATRPFICHFLYHVCDFNLVFPAYSVPSSGRSPFSGGPSVTGAAQVAEPQDNVEAQPSDEAVGGGGVPVTVAAVAACATMQATAGGGSPPPRCYQGVPLMSQPKRWPLMILLARLARQGACLSPPKRPTMAAWSLTSSWGTPRVGPSGMSPSTRPLVWPIGRLPRPRTYSTKRVVASSMNNDACCSGLPCSWSGQRRRGQGRRLGNITLT